MKRPKLVHVNAAALTGIVQGNANGQLDFLAVEHGGLVCGAALNQVLAHHQRMLIKVTLAFPSSGTFKSKNSWLSLVCVGWVSRASYH